MSEEQCTLPIGKYGSSGIFRGILTDRKPGRDHDNPRKCRKTGLGKVWERLTAGRRELRLAARRPARFISWPKTMICPGSIGLEYLTSKIESD